MKTKSILIFSICLLLFSLSSCVNTRGELPYGKWQSSDKVLTIDINPDAEEFYGVYLKDNCEIEVYTFFSEISKEFAVYNVNDVNAHREEKIVDFYLLAYFNGSYTLKNGKLYYEIKPHWGELTGYKTIILEKIEEYDVLKGNK